MIWKKSAPTGHYKVRVDAFSLCGESGARWTLEAFRGGVSAARSTGFSGESDT